MNEEDNYEHVVPGILYVPENVPGKGAEGALQDFLAGCDCRQEANCGGASCSCVGSAGGNYETVNGATVLRNTDKPIFECHEGCGCDAERCRNRCVQSGPVSGLVVKTAEGSKGLGLFTENGLSSGRFVCCYAGEVIGEREAEARLARQDRLGSMNYILFADERRAGDGALVCRTVVDLTAVGNVGRYANHSCDPNLAMFTVRTGQAAPHVALFARRDIAAGEELTFDYGGGGSDDGCEGGERKKCLCGARTCRGFLPLSQKLNIIGKAASNANT